MEEIKALYEETVKENMQELEHILDKHINIRDPAIVKQLEGLLHMSCQNLITKWTNGRKYARTAFAKQAFPNYPRSILKLSVSIDAIINLLDEILDEEMDKQAKALHMVEIIRMLAIHKYQHTEKIMNEAIGSYFNKIISIAVLEEIYRNLIKNETDNDKIILYSTQIYDCRSLDMDIYVELPLLKLYGEIKENVVGIARIFRAINLIKKDIADIQHDKENHVETVVTLFFGNPATFKSRIKSLLNEYIKRGEKAGKDGEARDIINNFNTMIKKELEFIDKQLENMP